MRQPRDIAVAVGKPLEQRRGLRKMRLQRLLFQCDMAHAASQLRRHAPRRKAHGQHRHAQFVNGGIAQRRVVLNAALRPARQYDAPRIKRADLGDIRIRGHDLAIDPPAAHAPRQRLRLRAAIAQYENAVSFHADPSAVRAPNAPIYRHGSCRYPVYENTRFNYNNRLLNPCVVLKEAANLPLSHQSARLKQVNALSVSHGNHSFIPARFQQI